MLDGNWKCTGTCGVIGYATLMSGRGGKRSCSHCGSLAVELPEERSNDRIVPGIGSTKTVERLCERVNSLLVLLERAESYLRMMGESQCEACGSWMHTAESSSGNLRGAYKYQGKRTCHACIVGILERMAEDDGPEWDAYTGEATRKAAMLGLAEIALRVPTIQKAANKAMDCMSEEPGIAQAWLAARMTVSTLRS